jgi:hypothetical protein
MLLFSISVHPSLTLLGSGPPPNVRALNVKLDHVPNVVVVLVVVLVAGTLAPPL